MSLVNRNYAHMGPTLILRSDSLLGYTEQSSLMMEKRQLFLRSYQFCRKKSLTEKIKRYLVRVKKVMWLKLRSACKLRRLVWSRLRYSFYCRRRRNFIRFRSPNHHYCSYPSSSSSSSSCFR
ncbi:uncharacterized protein LOC122724690 [Manihot esculenta]|uniref:Uncharacterized protein n=1 Tax=Manihot esculenta TaxID=3983 RepID=A0A2C9VBU8_MANES|nr:uncharacterized protein LOC122724690 [Manihot esculenta]OAY42475.1 hypothetical protein MANES_09G182800v8 [Manihot esculenta]